MKTPVFLLKTKSSPHDGYEEYFCAAKNNGCNYKPLFVPVLEHKLNTSNFRKVRDLFISGEIAKQYGGLIFTSQRAVEGFAKVIQNEVGKSISVEISRFLNIYSVGPATYRSLNILRETHLPHAQLIGEDAGTGQILAGLILAHYNDNHRRNNTEKNGLSNNNINNNANEVASKDNNSKPPKKLPLLFLVGEQHRDIIPKTLTSTSLPPQDRIEVNELIVYGTSVMESFAMDFEAAIKNEERISLEESLEPEDQSRSAPGSGLDVRKGKGKTDMWVVVFSPTGCDAMLRTLNLLPGSNDKLKEEDGGRRHGYNGRLDCHIATIGPTTRDHLRTEFGVEPDVCADVPSPEGLGKGIAIFMEKVKNGNGDV